MKQGVPTPWLTATGVEIPTARLREIAAGWDLATWEAYLDWYEGGRHESLLHPDSYDSTCEEETESIFEQIAQDSSDENRECCERILTSLPELEAEVLRRYFLEGRTEVQIAFELHRSQTGVSLIKSRALSRLKRGNRGDEMLPCRFMRGEIFSSEEFEPSLWDEPLASPLRDRRPYQPNDHRLEFEKIYVTSVREAALGLPELSGQILFLRYWCDWLLNQVARSFKLGVNVTQEIESAAIKKVKENAVVSEIGISGGDQCA